MSEPTIPTTGGYAGPSWLLTGSSDFNALASVFRQLIAGKAFAGLVKVLAVHGGGVGAPATVDVQLMVNQIDGFGNQTPHGEISGLPCFRLQGGTNAIITDPVIGDEGQAVICDRDISTVKATGAISGPGSYRQNDWADGCYFGSFLGKTPIQYIRFTPAGITIVDMNGNTIVMASGGITLTGTLVTVQGNLQVDGNINATGTISP